MKNILFVCLASFVAISAVAAEKNRKPAQAAVTCPKDIAGITTMISSSGSCYSANNIANQCAWGDSADVQIAGSAIAVCEKDFVNKLSVTDKATYASLQQKCSDKYVNQQGTMYRSMTIFCALDVSRVFSDIYSPIQTGG